MSRTKQTRDNAKDSSNSAANNSSKKGIGIVPIQKAPVDEEELMQGKFDPSQTLNIVDGFQFNDNRSESFTQRKIQDGIENNAFGNQSVIAQKIDENNKVGISQMQELEEEELQMKKNPVQMVEEEELLQGKLNTAQKQELEEELMQGKFEPIQKQELEEEELQMKTDYVQMVEEEELMQGKFESLQMQEEEEELQMENASIQFVEEEEELMQGKFESIQKQELEEEELQMKKNSIQMVEEEEPLQGNFSTIQKKKNDTGLPDQLKSGIESISGTSLDDVRVHYNSSKPSQVQAHAFAQGTDIHVAPGQEKHLPHEAWHVVQQKEGRVKPTTRVKGMSVNDDVSLEQEADVMGAKALQKVHDDSSNNMNETVSNNGDNPAQLAKASIIGVIFGQTNIYDGSGRKVVANIAKGSEIEIDETNEIQGDGRKLVHIISGSRNIIWKNPDALLKNEDDLWISKTRYVKTEEGAEEVDLESLGTIDLSGGEEGGDSITLGKDGFEMTIAGQKISLSKSKLKLHTEQEKVIETPRVGLKTVFPVPLGPLAPLALTFSLGFTAGTTLKLTLEEDLSVSSDDESRMDIKGTGTASADVEASAGVGLGLSAGIASIVGEIIAALTAAISGSITLNASVQSNAGIINAGASAVMNLKGAIGAKLKGAVTLAFAFFSKEFGLTFKEWTFGEANLEKQIAEIGSAESFIPSKSELGVNDEEQDVIDKLTPKPTPTQEKWVKMLLKDFQKAKSSAEKLRAEGLNIEDPSFWDIIDSYDNQSHYKIYGGRLIRCTALEAMPLLVSQQLEQAIADLS